MLNERDMKAWQHLGCASMTVKLTLHSLEHVLRRLENPHLYDMERSDPYVLWSVRDAIKTCRTCLTNIEEQPL